MEKNWLIRTKSNHILGPISKEKVLELYQNGSIRADDEVCSGNGFWFFIRENELVEKYLMGEDIQGFNPISEAKDVLTSRSSEERQERTNDDITVIKGLSLPDLNGPEVPTLELVEEETDQPLSEVVEIPVLKAIETKVESQVSSSQTKSSIQKKIKKNKRQKVVQKKQGYLKHLGIIFFILLFVLLYFRKSIIRFIFSANLSVLDSAIAQESIPKKKSS